MSLKGYSLSYYILCVIALLAMFATSLTNPLLAIFAKEIGATGVWIGLAVAGYWVSRVLLEVPSGILSSKYGYYAPMVLGLVLTALGTAVCMYVSNPFQLILGRALQGLGAPLFFAVSMTFIVNLFPVDRRGSAMGVFQGIEFFGTILGSTFSGYLITAFGFKGGFLLSTILVVISIIIIMAPRNIRAESRAQPRTASIPLSSLLKVFGNKTLLIVSSATLAEFIMSTGILYTVFPLYANEGLGFSLADIGLFMGARSVGYVVAMLTMGAVADRVGRRPVLIFGLASTAVMIVALSLVSSFLGIVAVISVLGVTTGAIWIVCPVLAAEAVDPSLRGAAIGTYRTFFDLGSIFGPIIMTWIFSAYGITPCFYLSGALLVLNLIPSLRIKETK
ncbi:MFS transporter [Candidatus Bathyarchaeota archaeon]|nr:MFS transporter [Candidatus Bathyarchaeota archaeon]